MDCGMFVCRYAHALYSMRDRDITFGDSKKGGGRITFLELAITQSEAFQFGDKDILRIRTELCLLIERLAIIYKKWKKRNDKANNKADM
jgi:hypothetical protein